MSNNPYENDEHHIACSQNPESDDYNVDCVGDPQVYVVLGECTCDEIYDDMAADAADSRREGILHG